MADKTKTRASQRKPPKIGERVTVRVDVARKTVKRTEKASHSAPSAKTKGNGALKVEKRSKKELPDALALFSEVYGRL